MDTRKFFPSKYIKCADLNGKIVPVVVRSVSMQEVGTKEDPQMKPVIYFQGKEKGLVLMTDLTFLEDPRVTRLGEQTLTGMLWGGPKSQTSLENIFWTWAPHPLSIALTINGEPSHMGAVWLPHEGMDRAYIALHYEKAPGHCNIVMQWGEGIQKERWLFRGARPGLNEHMNLARGNSGGREDPLKRVCSVFVAAVDERLPLQTIWTGVRVAEMMAWLSDELLSSKTSRSFEVKKWEPTTR